MKTLIVGTGVIGTLYGWALAEAGVDVTHYMRPGRSATLAGGVEMDVLDERKGYPRNNLTHYDLRCTEQVQPGDGYELVIVPTNTYQLLPAIQELAPLSPDAIFLIFSGNWEGTQPFEAYLPRERYLLGYPDGGGTVRDGVYWTNLGGEVHLGVVDDVAQPALAQVADLFAQADIQADVQPNMLHWLWVHNALSTPFAAGVGKHGEIGAFLKDSALLKQCLAASQEMLELCRQRGVDLEQYPDAGQVGLPAWLFLIIFRMLFRFNESMQRFTAHGIAAVAETSYHYHAILATADEIGSEAPNLRALGVYLPAREMQTA